MKGQEKMFLSIKINGEVLSKLKSRGIPCDEFVHL